MNTDRRKRLKQRLRLINERQGSAERDLRTYDALGHPEYLNDPRKLKMLRDRVQRWEQERACIQRQLECPWYTGWLLACAVAATLLYFFVSIIHPK